MKSILILLFFFVLINGAYAQDDRYFNSGKRTESLKVKVAHKYHKRQYHAQRQHRNRVPVPRYIGETYSPDPVQWVAKSTARGEGEGEVLGGRPSGCPRAFCGCGASLHLFGRIIPALNLAANWLRFPRAAPAPNMVAARRGHVFVLKQHLHDKVWLAFDANSGGHRSRIHPRSIAGFVIVNPRG